MPSVPGYPTAPSTSADFPLTVTSMGELITAKRLDGKNWPGSGVGLVGPRPVARRDRISPAAAGFEALTSEKSLECAIAGPLPVITISGRESGMPYSTDAICPPPFWRRLAGSSVMDAVRSGVALLKRLFAPPSVTIRQPECSEWERRVVSDGDGLFNVKAELFTSNALSTAEFRASQSGRTSGWPAISRSMCLRIRNRISQGTRNRVVAHGGA
jgi:hypothetical protein